MFHCVYPIVVTLKSLNWTLIETLINSKILLQFRILNQLLSTQHRPQFNWQKHFRNVTRSFFLNFPFLPLQYPINNVLSSRLTVTPASERRSVRRQRWMLNTAQVLIKPLYWSNKWMSLGINHHASPISSPSDIQHHQGGIKRLSLIPKVLLNPKPLITINSRLLLSIRLKKHFKRKFWIFYCPEIVLK